MLDLTKRYALRGQTDLELLNQPIIMEAEERTGGYLLKAYTRRNGGRSDYDFWTADGYYYCNPDRQPDSKDLVEVTQ